MQPNFKQHIIRNKNHLRFVAGLPCAMCRIGGFSQAAHIGRLGMGIKNPDSLVIPLCCARPGIEGCHIESAKNEKKFFAKRGGIQAAKRLASDLWENTGDWAKACEFIVRF